MHFSRRLHFGTFFISTIHAVRPGHDLDRTSPTRAARHNHGTSHGSFAPRPAGTWSVPTASSAASLTHRPGMVCDGAQTISLPTAAAMGAWRSGHGCWASLVREARACRLHLSACAGGAAAAAAASAACASCQLLGRRGGVRAPAHIQAAGAGRAIGGTAHVTIDSKCWLLCRSGCTMERDIEL